MAPATSGLVTQYSEGATPQDDPAIEREVLLNDPPSQVEASSSIASLSSPSDSSSSGIAAASA